MLEEFENTSGSLFRQKLEAVTKQLTKPNKLASTVLVWNNVSKNHSSLVNSSS